MTIIEPELLYVDGSRRGEPFWFALPQGHALEPSVRIGPRKVSAAELLLLTGGHCLREQALSLRGRESLSTRADPTATSLETLVNLVAAGQGITLVPALALGIVQRLPSVAVRRSKGGSAQRLVRLVRRPGFPHRTLLEQVVTLVRRVLPVEVTPVER